MKFTLHDQIMKGTELFRRQFLLTVKDDFDLPWISKKILHLNLFYHPELEFTHLSEKEIEIYLLGFIFDYKNPEFSNQQVVNSFSGIHSFDAFIKHLAQYSGHFVLILRLGKKIILMSDACGQYEIYYDTTYSTFGSQPKLMSKVIPLKPHSSADAKEFYQSSPEFKKQLLFIGDTTHVENIKHLLPNHYIDIEDQSVTRYFPNTPIKPISIDEAVPIATERLHGFIKAASLRNKLVMGLTAGVDSRTLFLSNLDVDCKYYVTRHPHMADDHYEIRIPQQVAKLFNKDFRAVTESPLSEHRKRLQEQSIDFPRHWNEPDKMYEDHLLINGNLSEIARNGYGRYTRVNVRMLASFRNFLGSNYAYHVYGDWMQKSSKTIAQNGYHILDLYYWEERMGNWTAKTKTEWNAMGKDIYSPFCSHDLLEILLSTPQKLRDRYNNILYKSIFKSISPVAAKIPINPSFLRRIYTLSTRLGFYGLIQRSRFLIKNLKHKQ